MFEAARVAWAVEVGAALVAGDFGAGLQVEGLCIINRTDCDTCITSCGRVIASVERTSWRSVAPRANWAGHDSSIRCRHDATLFRYLGRGRCSHRFLEYHLILSINISYNLSGHAFMVRLFVNRENWSGFFEQAVMIAGHRPVFF